MRFLTAATIVVALAAGALLGGVFDEGGASAAPSIEAERAPRPAASCSSNRPG